MDAREVVCHKLGAKEVISILAVCKIVAREICTTEDDLVVKTVEFDVLETPAFVDAFGNEHFSETGQIGRMVHTHLNSPRKITDERSQK